VKVLDGIPFEVLLSARGWTVADDGCWEWTPQTMKLMVGGVYHRVPVIAYKTWVSETFEEGDRIYHTCRNKKCINPDHLRRVQSKRRLYRQIVEDHNTGWYTPGDIAGMHEVPLEYVTKTLRNAEWRGDLK